MDYSEITRARMWSDVDQAHALYTDMRQNDPVSLIETECGVTLIKRMRFTPICAKTIPFR